MKTLLAFWMSITLVLVVGLSLFDTPFSSASCVLERVLEPLL